MLVGHKNKKAVQGYAGSFAAPQGFSRERFRRSCSVFILGSAYVPCAAHPTQRTQAKAHGPIPGAQNAKTLRCPPAHDPEVSVRDCACTPASPDDPAHGPSPSYASTSPING